MQQACSRCGYVSDRPARFCRQCGSQLFAETEASSADTRNYAPKQGPSQYAEQQPAYSYAPGQHSKWGDDQTPETTPFYRPPIAPQYQTPFTEQKRTNWGKWILISLLTFLLVCVVGAGGLIYWGKKWVEQRVESSAGDVPVIVPGVPPPPAAPPAPGAPPPASAAASLDSYKYPDARITKSYKEGPSEVVEMTTDDDLEDVREYYQEKFKNSLFSIKDENSKKFVFTSLGQPLITVIVQPDEKREDKTQIILSSVNIAIPKILLPKIEIR